MSPPRRGGLDRGGAEATTRSAGNADGRDEECPAPPHGVFAAAPRGSACSRRWRTPAEALSIIGGCSWREKRGVRNGEGTAARRAEEGDAASLERLNTVNSFVLYGA
jgi:hypothetical protein